MEQKLGQDLPVEGRAQYLRDNCDAIEEISYTRHFTAEELTDRKEQLSNVDIDIDNLEIEKKDAMSEFKTRLKPLGETRKTLLRQLRAKSETVTGNTFKFIDGETRTVGYYNARGELVYSRPAMAQEMQKTVFMSLRTGTDNR